ncbi:MAG: iron ABC transporter permease [Verrucomicrobiota bacterium]|jgi:iron complex transport system permease protein|nr:iron ABC transporter permease [Verrucomicrobiota bacterium]
MKPCGTSIFFFLLFLLVLLACPFAGAERLQLRDVWEGLRNLPTLDSRIFLHLRLPRVVLGLLAGGTLAMTGAALQVLFRNPLAEPWTLGMAGGASLGAFAARAFPVLWLAAGPFNTSQVSALVGAGGALMLVLFLARRTGGVGTPSLLLAGITIGIISGGAILVAGGFIAPWKLAEYHRWLLGGLGGADWRQVAALAVLALPGLVILQAQAGEYNPFGLGEEMAAGQGVDVARVRRLTLIGAGLASAAVAAVAGPIGFIGLLAPHAVRRFIGPDMRVVMLGSFFLGGALLAGCDTVGRVVASPHEIPVGALTALLGGPLFLLLLVRRNTQGTAASTAEGNHPVVES